MFFPPRTKQLNFIRHPLNLEEKTVALLRGESIPCDLRDFGRGGWWPTSSFESSESQTNVSLRLLAEQRNSIPPDPSSAPGRLPASPPQEQDRGNSSRIAV
ncbi:hypothetical protein RHECNPAF_430051 [Rhizobium etli CNPAF512]|nr:hypothetical protein RHECNPAF_430051 [Rhizobium etli CNPAF512]